jgi:hypothetical protein
MNSISDDILEEHLLPFSEHLQRSGISRFVEERYQQSRPYPIDKRLDPENKMNYRILLRAIQEEDVRTVDLFRRYVHWLLIDENEGLELLNEMLENGTTNQIRMLFSIYLFNNRAAALVIGYLVSNTNRDAIRIPLRTLMFMTKFFAGALEIKPILDMTPRRTILDKIRELVEYYVDSGYIEYNDLLKTLKTAKREHKYVFEWTAWTDTHTPRISLVLDVNKSTESYTRELQNKELSLKRDKRREERVQRQIIGAEKIQRNLEEIRRDREIDLEAEKMRQHFEKLTPIPALVDEEEIDFYDMNYGDDEEYQEED